VKISIRKADISDIDPVAELVKSLSHYYLENGKRELPAWFDETLSHAAFVDRFTHPEYHSFLAEAAASIVGYISIKNGFHLHHLFVLPEYHNRGIARSLWQYCVETLSISMCTVRSSLYAVPAYQKLGFTASSAIEYKDGIRYQSMTYQNTPDENHRLFAISSI
jgi:ribosomal protein S18 acetylase RimI-like enzyme